MSSDTAHFRLAGLPVTLTSRLFQRVMIVGVLLGFLAVMIAGLASIWAVSRDQALTMAIGHSNAVQTAVADVRMLIEQSEAARRGYLLTRDPTMRDSFEAAVAQEPAALARVQELTRGDVRQQAQLVELREAIKGHQASARWSIELVAQDGQDGQNAAIRAFQTDRAPESMRRIRTIIDQIASEELQRLEDRTRLQRAAVRSLYIALGLAAPLLLVVAVGSTMVILRYTRDLSQTGSALRTLNEGLEAAVAQRTAGLARANQEIQRFAYIVSHDLRSPLVNVMGFTAELETSLKPVAAQLDRIKAEAPELLSKEASEAVREEAPEALRFIRTSTQKMDRLINAILEISRSGRRTLKPEPLEMNKLLGDVAATLKARAEAAGAEIMISPDLPGIISDRLAVEQVFANLLENAVKYLKPGRPGRIEVTGERRAGHAVISVADNGRGIDPKDHERIFELFRRSGAQDQPGEGIGLANVRAIVYRLGGTIECESALDQGATFRVFLPAVLRVEQEAFA
jgi:signal transduction histidine kinase